MNGQPGQRASGEQPIRSRRSPPLDMQRPPCRASRGSPGGYESQCRVVGAARVISKEGLRRVRLARELSQRMGDQELLSKAALFNAGQVEHVYPGNPDDWQIIYNELEPMA